MINREADRVEVRPSRLTADVGDGSAEMLGWLVDERGIEPRDSGLWPHCAQMVAVPPQRGKHGQFDPEWSFEANTLDMHVR
jgi:hypothetical protein